MPTLVTSSAVHSSHRKSDAVKLQPVQDWPWSMVQAILARSESLKETLTRLTDMKMLEIKTTVKNSAAPKVTIMNRITATCLDRLSRLFKMEKADMYHPRAAARRKRPPVIR